MEGNKIKQSDDLASFGGKHVEGSIIIGLDLISTPLQYTPFYFLEISIFAFFPFLTFTIF